MDLARTHENIFEHFEKCSDDNSKLNNIPRVLQTWQNRLWALKLSGCKLASFKSFVNFFRRKVHTKKSAKKQGYKQMFTEEEIRYNLIELKKRSSHENTNLYSAFITITNLSDLTEYSN